MLLQLDLHDNKLGPEGAVALAPAIAGSSSITSLDLSYNELGAKGANVLASGISANGSLAKLLIGDNMLGDEGVTMLCDAIRESKVSKVQELDLNYNRIGYDGVKAIAALCGARKGSMTRADISGNDLNAEAKAVLRGAVDERVFELML